MACVLQSERVLAISCEVQFPFLTSYCICIVKETKITSLVFFDESHKIAILGTEICLQQKIQNHFNGKDTAFHAKQNKIRLSQNSEIPKKKIKLCLFLTHVQCKVYKNIFFSK